MQPLQAPSFFIRGGALALALGLTAHAQTPVLRWAFDAAKGAPATTTWISGGTLGISGDRLGYIAFLPAGGVGPATPGVLNCAANVYGDGGAAQVVSGDSPLLADAELPQFVVTMWIKPTVPPTDQPYARLLVISPADEEKAATGLFVALHNENLEVGVNGNVNLVQLGELAIRANEWAFVAFAYDGFASNPYHSAEMISLLQSARNGAVLIGGANSPVTVAGTVGVNKGAPGFNVPAGPLPLNGLSVAVGSSTSTRARAFCGLIDDVRVYNGLLTLEQIEAIRRSALSPR